MSLPAAAFLWDMDGTLVDTEPYWIAAEHEIVEEHGGTWSDEFAHQPRQHRPARVRGVHQGQLGGAVGAGADRRRAAVRVVAASPSTCRGGRAPASLLSALRAGVPSALVTMSWRLLADAVAGRAPDGTFAAVVTGDEVSHGKPHPEPYRAAARLLGVSPRTASPSRTRRRGCARRWPPASRRGGAPRRRRARDPGAVHLDTLSGLTPPARRPRQTARAASVVGGDDGA